MTADDPRLHVRGESRFVDDLPLPQGLLHAALCTSTVPRGRLLGMDTAEAMAVPGVVAVFSASDIPGRNHIGVGETEEPLLATGDVQCVGEPIALVIGTDPRAARAGAARVRTDIEPLPAVFDPREAFRAGLTVGPSRVFALGSVEAAWSACAIIAEGRADSGAQEHVYLETQAALAIPREDGGVKVYSATQAPTAVQRALACVLGFPMNMVEIETPRLGGGFGGKEEQATSWAACAALAAVLLRRPVKLVLRRQEDMRWTGKRHPYSSDYRLGLDADGRFLAYEVVFYQNAGATPDLSTPVLERTLFHATNAYRVPHVRATGHSCRTNLPSNTAFRGFGAPQAMFVMECAITHAASLLGIRAEELQRRNLLRKGDMLPFGMRLETDSLTACWDALSREAAQRESPPPPGTTPERYVSGRAVMPVCFGISFTNTFLNQAGSLVHIYTDGSVSVSTGAVEMGQGVYAKIREVTARTLGVRADLVRIEPTSTTRVANTSPTAASTGADLNGNATRLACEMLRTRLLQVAADLLRISPGTIAISDGLISAAGAAVDLTWSGLVREAWLRRVSLSAFASYATPDIHFDRSTSRGRPFSYHAAGVARVEAVLDALRGTYRITAVRIVHDAGRSLLPQVDRGQMEGGLVQGIGWMTSEDVRHAPDGRLLTDTLTTYKVPDLFDVPGLLDVRFLESEPHPAGLLGAKTVGEPPFMYGIGAYFALLDALRAARPDAPLLFHAPLTPERVLQALA